MGLLGDIEEGKKGWKKSPWYRKVFVVLSVYLALSSLAGLSSTIVAWKGFIADGLEFYDTYVREFVRFLFSFLNLNVPKTSIDVFVSVMYFFSLLLKYLPRKINKKNRRLSIAVVLLLFLNLFIALILKDNFLIASIAAIMIWALAIFTILSMAALNDKLTKKERRNIFVLVCSPPLLLLILGAINTGLKG